MAEARAEIGVSGRPNKYTRWYANGIDKGSEFLSVAWCAIFISWVAEEAGVRSKTGTEAWTVGWANWYAAKGRWGTKPKVGALVFYDWGGGESRSGIDHIGIVEKVHSNGSITTIEGNHSNKVARVERSSSIVGYGYWN